MLNTATGTTNPIIQLEVFSPVDLLLVFKRKFFGQCARVKSLRFGYLVNVSMLD
jgi:hypothetical protein